MADDYTNDTTTTGYVPVGGTATGVIETASDLDWFRVELEAGKTYVIDLEGSDSGRGTLESTVLAGLYDAEGDPIAGTEISDGGAGDDARLTFTASESGTYYIAARGHRNETGTYAVRVGEIVTDDTRAGARDLGDITDLGRPRFTRASLDGSDDAVDYFRFTLLEAKKVGLGLRQQDANADLFLEDAHGTVLGSSTRDDRATEWVSETLLGGTYYVRVTAKETADNDFKLRYGVSDPDQSVVTVLRQARVENLNATPGFEQTSYAFDLEENADGSTTPVALGTVSATDPDEDPLTYSIAAGDDTGLFAIDSSTGALSYLGTGEDHESGRASYALTVRASDGTLQSDIAVTVNVVDVAEAPQFAQTSYAFDLAENVDGSTAAVAVGTVSATDPEEGPLSYAIAAGNDAGLFAIDSSTGALSYQGTGEDRESDTTSYALTVRASDGALHADAAVIVNVVDVAEAPQFARTSYAFDLAENADGSTTPVALGAVSATDPEDGAVSYGIAAGNEAGLFAIDSSTGALSYQGTGEDYESDTTTYELTVRASDSSLHSDTAVAVNVTDVTETPETAQEQVITRVTGTPIKFADYSDPQWAERDFRYGESWAGRGFKLSGSQRGAPEEIEIAEVDGITAMRFKAADRSAAWYEEHPGAVDHVLYGEQDNSEQDDFFLHSPLGWRIGDNPYVVAQVHLGSAANLTSLRMPVVHEAETGEEERGYPGIFWRGGKLHLRGTGGYDVEKSPPDLPSKGWMTLGMTVTDDGDMIYLGRYGTHSVEELFADPDFEYRNSEISQGSDYHPVSHKYGAMGMFSQVFSSDEPNAIAYVEYGKNLVLEEIIVNAADEQESIAQSVSEPSGQDFPADASSQGRVAVDGAATGEIGTERDVDWYAVELVEGRTYVVELRGSPTGDGTLGDPYLRGIFDADGVPIPGTIDDDGGKGLNSRLTFTAAQSGTHHIAAGAYSRDLGTYEVTVEDASADDTREGATDLGDITALADPRFPRASLDGDSDQIDYFRFSLTEAKRVSLALRQLDANADLFVEDVDGNVLYSSTRAGRVNESIAQTLAAGTYYARVEAQETGQNDYVFRYGVEAADDVM